MFGSDGGGALEMCGRASSMVCLTYQHPAGPASDCLNSKTARVVSTVRPRHGTPFTLSSDHGGALELLMPEPVQDVQPVV